MKPTNKPMKRLSLYLFLILFTLQTPSQADDIRDFQIEGISVGDSLLDYLSEEKINEPKKFYYPDSKKFYNITFYSLPRLETYDGIQFYIKKKDKRYIVYGIVGQIYFKDNIKDCYKKKDEIVNELSEEFKNTKKKDYGTKKHAADSSSTSNTVVFFFKTGGNINVVCYDWSGKNNRTDGLGINIETQEIRDFIENEAFK